MYEDRSSDAYQKLPHADSRCGSRWSGFNTAHCPSCHRTFTTPNNFDAHRSTKGCVDPATLGMVLAAGRVYEAWAQPSPDELPLAWR